MFTSNRTIKWIENLAEQELSINAGERVSIDLGSTKEEVLAEETLAFTRELFLQFESLVAIFNGRVNRPALQIRLQRSSEPRGGFFLARSGMRLQLASARHGVFHVQCHKWIPEDPHRPMVMFSGMLEAQFETFHDVEWYFLGSKVTAEQVARHYLTEFIQVTRPSND